MLDVKPKDIRKLKVLPHTSTNRRMLSKTKLSQRKKKRKRLVPGSRMPDNY